MESKQTANATVNHESKNIIQQLLNFTTQLTNKIDGEGNLKNKSQDEINDIISSINDLEYDLVYFKDEMDDRQSEISKIGFQLELIRNLSLNTGKKLEKADSIEEKYKIKNAYLLDTMEALEVIDKSVMIAQKEERDARRKDAIKDIFADTQVKIKDMVSQVQLIKDDLIQQSDAIRSSFENTAGSLNKQLSVIESHTSDIRENSQKMKEYSDTIDKLIKDWKLNSQANIDDKLNELFAQLDEHKDQKQNSIKDEIGEIEKAGKNALEAFEEFADHSESMLRGEIFKQVLVYAGTGLGLINFILLMLLFFIK